MKSKYIMFGVLNINKPKGLTSHDVVGIVRKITGIKQVGHTGTLDPFATGVLPVCIGKATRLIEYFEDTKEYLAAIKFGYATDTYDIEGKITHQSNKKINLNDIQQEISNFKGEIKQIPPLYSAIKVNGKKLYNYARAGENVEVPSRNITVYDIKPVNFDEENQIAKIFINCSKGTYIRSIANDLGKNLGCYAHLIELQRTRAGSYKIENSIELPIKLLPKEENSNFCKYSIDENAKDKLLKNIQTPILPMEKIELTENEYKKVINGNPIEINNKKLKSDDFLILVYNNCILAIGQYSGTEIKVKKVFR